jgi:hypothetical protein
MWALPQRARGPTAADEGSQTHKPQPLAKAIDPTTSTTDDATEYACVCLMGCTSRANAVVLHQPCNQKTKHSRCPVLLKQCSRYTRAAMHDK